MAEFNALKDKYIKVSESQIEELMKKQLEHLSQSKCVLHKQINESQTKIENLTTELGCMKESLHSMTTELEQRGLEFTRHMEQLNQLESQKTKLLDEIHSLKLKRNSLKSAKPSLHDEQILENGKKKLNLYKEVTGIKWNYWELDQNISGYVSNRSDYIKHFSYKNEKTKELSDCLWLEICQAVKKGKGISEDENCKENRDTNQ